MLELVEIPQTARERIEEIGTADLVIGVFAPFTPDGLERTVARMRESIGRLYMQVRTVVVHATDQSIPSHQDVTVLSVPSLRQDFTTDPTYSISDAYHGLLAVGQSLGARAVAVLLSDL